MSVILPNPWAVTLVYVVGLISPEAVTSETRFSWFATLAVCTVTTPLFAWFTLNRTIPPSTTTAPAPIATLCHVFIRFLFEPPCCRRASKLPPRALFQAIVGTIKPAGTQRSARLPLPYIRPFGSKCFAGGLLHFRSSGFKQGTYRNRRLHRCQPHPVPFYVQNTRKERDPSRLCLSSIILSPLNGNVKMSPYEQGDICIEPERATTSGRYLQMREGGVGVCQSRRTPVSERAPN